jgi:membrane fusion protein, multidrug efflux system
MHDTVDNSPAKTAFAERRKRRPWRRLSGLLLAGALVVLAWQGFDRLEAPQPSSPAGRNAANEAAATIRAASVVSGAMPIVVDALGTVTPLSTVSVRSQVSGRLVDVLFAEGQNVKRGDELARVDQRPFDASLAQAKALIEKDTAALSQAEADLARYQALNRQDSISRQQVDDQAFLVAQDKAAIASDQAQIDAANLNISYAHIVAPISGRLGLRQVDPGNYVTPNDTTPIVVIAQMDPISAVFSIPEDKLGGIAKRAAEGAALPVEVRDRANENTLAKGSLETFDNQIDPTTGTVKMRAIFDNAGQSLFPNQFVNVRMTVDTIADKPLAPAAAVQLGANGTYVYLIDDAKTAHVRSVKTGPSANGLSVITQGLAVGDVVAVDGVDRLRDGAKVRVVDAPTPAASGDGSDQGVQTGQRQNRGGGAGAGGRAKSTPSAAPTAQLSPAGQP